MAMTDDVIEKINDKLKDIKSLFFLFSLDFCNFSSRNEANPLLQIEVEPTSDVSFQLILSFSFLFVYNNKCLDPVLTPNVNINLVILVFQKQNKGLMSCLRATSKQLKHFMRTYNASISM